MTEAHDPAPRAARRKNTALLVLTAAAVVVVAAALVVVFTGAGTRSYPEESPEGVVQRYVQAVVDGDLDAAIEHLVPEDAEDCERQPTGGGDYRVTLKRTTQLSSTARVEVIVSQVYDAGPFGPDEYQSDEMFELERIGGQWKLSTMPWQFAVCAESGF